MVVRNARSFNSKPSFSTPMSNLNVEAMAAKVQRFVDRNTLDDNPRMWEDDVAVALVHMLRQSPRGEWPMFVERFAAIASEFLTDSIDRASLSLVGRLTLGWLEDPAAFEAYKAKTRPTVPYLGCV